MTWKRNLQSEVSTSSLYVLHSAPQKRSDHYCLYYYYCNHSGLYNSRSQGKGALKLQGSSKLGDHCVAYIQAIVKYIFGQVEVEVCDHHLHEAQLFHF